MAKIKIKASGTYTVGNKDKVEFDTKAPVTATLQGNGAPITKLKIDWEKINTDQKIILDMNSFLGGPLTVELKGYQSTDQIAIPGATITGVDPANPALLNFTWTGPDGATYSGTLKLKGKNTNWNNNPIVICFAAGTRLRTPSGYRPIESLRPGEKVLCWDGREETIRWIGARRVSWLELQLKPALRPVRIRARALGPGRPMRDLVVSAQHRIALSGPEMELWFAEPTVLVPAVSLIDGRHAVREDRCEGVTYLHLLLDRHCLLDAEGAPAESLWLGEQALEAIGRETRAELAALFPELMRSTAGGLLAARSQPVCAPCLTAREGRVAAAARRAQPRPAHAARRPVPA